MAMKPKMHEKAEYLMATILKRRNKAFQDLAMKIAQGERAEIVLSRHVEEADRQLSPPYKGKNLLRILSTLLFGLGVQGLITYWSAQNISMLGIYAILVSTSTVIEFLNKGN